MGLEPRRREGGEGKLMALISIEGLKGFMTGEGEECQKLRVHECCAVLCRAVDRKQKFPKQNLGHLEVENGMSQNDMRGRWRGSGNEKMRDRGVLELKRDEMRSKG